MVSGDYIDDVIVEQLAIAFFLNLGWKTTKCLDETYSRAAIPFTHTKVHMKTR
jgi:hypothetical protein